MTKPRRQITACFTLLFFILTQHPYLWAAFPVKPSAPAVEKNVFPQEVSSVRMPEQIGKIEEFFKGANGEAVVIIQDAHSIPDAQKSIQKIVSFFQKQYGVRYVGLEGAGSRLDPQIFKSFPDKKILRQVFSQYLNRGELTAGTGAAVFSEGLESETVFQGVEDWDLYEQGLGLYLAAMNRESDLSKKLERWSLELNAQKEKIYPKELQELDAKLERFRKNEIDLMEIFKALSAVQMPARGTDLFAFFEEMKSEKTDSAAIEQEVHRIARLVAKHLNAKTPTPQTNKDLLAYHDKLQDFKISRIPAQAFALFLKELIAKDNLSIMVSKRLLGGIENQKKMRDLEGTKFFRDLEVYIKRVKMSLMHNQDQRILDARAEKFIRVEKLVKLELSREEWNEFKSGKAPEGQDPQEITPEDLKIHKAFYENAEKRDGAFLKNLGKSFPEKSKNQKDPRSALLVAGGFHAQGLTQRLKEKNISYLLVMPQIKNIPKETHYQAQMRDEVSWKNYFKTEKGKIDLYKAFVRGTRDRLLTGDPSNRLLKNWRDQIIRDLAEKEKIQKAGDYTKFLDEITKGGQQQAQDSGLTKAFEKIDRFVAGLRGLKAKNELTEMNIMKLVKPAMVSPRATGNALGIGSFATPESDLPDLAVVSRDLQPLAEQVSPAVDKQIPVHRDSSHSETRLPMPGPMIDIIKKFELKASKVLALGRIKRLRNGKGESDNHILNKQFSSLIQELSKDGFFPGAFESYFLNAIGETNNGVSEFFDGKFMRNGEIDFMTVLQRIWDIYNKYDQHRLVINASIKERLTGEAASFELKQVVLAVGNTVSSVAEFSAGFYLEDKIHLNLANLMPLENDIHGLEFVAHEAGHGLMRYMQWKKPEELGTAEVEMAANWAALQIVSKEEMSVLINHVSNIYSLTETKTGRIIPPEAAAHILAFANAAQVLLSPENRKTLESIAQPGLILKYEKLYSLFSWTPQESSAPVQAPSIETSKSKEQGDARHETRTPTSEQFGIAANQHPFPVVLKFGDEGFPLEERLRREREGRLIPLDFGIQALVQKETERSRTRRPEKTANLSRIPVLTFDGALKIGMQALFSPQENGQWTYGYLLSILSGLEGRAVGLDEIEKLEFWSKKEGAIMQINQAAVYLRGRAEPFSLAVDVPKDFGPMLSQSIGITPGQGRDPARFMNARSGDFWPVLPQHGFIPFLLWDSPVAGILSQVELSPSNQRVYSEFNILKEWHELLPEKIMRPDVLVTMYVNPPSALQEIRPLLDQYPPLEDPNGALPIHIMVGEWLDGYMETHIAPVNGGFRARIIKHWGTDEQAYQHFELSPGESQEFWAEIARIRAATAIYREGFVRTGVFAINDGAFVGTLKKEAEKEILARDRDGRPDLKVISTSGRVVYPEEFLPLQLAMDAVMYSPDAGNPENGRPLAWESPRRAFQAFIDGYVDQMTRHQGQSREQATEAALAIIEKIPAIQITNEGFPVIPMANGRGIPSPMHFPSIDQNGPARIRKSIANVAPFLEDFRSRQAGTVSSFAGDINDVRIGDEYSSRISGNRFIVQSAPATAASGEISIRNMVTNETFQLVPQYLGAFMNEMDLISRVQTRSETREKAASEEDSISLNDAEIKEMSESILDAVSHIHSLVLEKNSIIVVPGNSGLISENLIRAAWTALYPDETMPALHAITGNDNKALYKDMGEISEADINDILTRKIGEDYRSSPLLIVDDYMATGGKYEGLRRNLVQLGQLQEPQFVYLTGFPTTAKKFEKNQDLFVASVRKSLVGFMILLTTKMADSDERPQAEKLLGRLVDDVTLRGGIRNIVAAPKMTDQLQAVFVEAMEKTVKAIHNEITDTGKKGNVHLVISGESIKGTASYFNAAWARLYPENALPVISHLTPELSRNLYEDFDPAAGRQLQDSVMDQVPRAIEGDRLLILDDFLATGGKYRAFNANLTGIGFQPLFYYFTGNVKQQTSPDLFIGSTNSDLVHLISTIAILSKDKDRPEWVDKTAELLTQLATTGFSPRAETREIVDGKKMDLLLRRLEEKDTAGLRTAWKAIEEDVLKNGRQFSDEQLLRLFDVVRDHREFSNLYADGTSLNTDFSESMKQINPVLKSGRTQEEFAKVLSQWAQREVAGGNAGFDSVPVNVTHGSREKFSGDHSGIASVLLDPKKSLALFEVLTVFRTLTDWRNMEVDLTDGKVQRIETNQQSVEIAKNIFIRSDTGSFRRHLIYETDDSGRVLGAFELKIPGDWLSKAEVSSKDYEVAEALKPILEERVQVGVLVLTFPKPVTLKLYGKTQTESNLRVVVSESNFPAVYGRLEDYAGLSLQGKKRRDLLASGKEIQTLIPDAQVESVINQVALILRAIFNAGYTGNRDLVHLQNFTIEEKASGLFVSLPNDFYGYKKRSEYEDEDFGAALSPDTSIGQADANIRNSINGIMNNLLTAFPNQRNYIKTEFKAVSDTFVGDEQVSPNKLVSAAALRIIEAQRMTRAEARSVKETFITLGENKLIEILRGSVTDHYKQLLESPVRDEAQLEVWKAAMDSLMDLIAPQKDQPASAELKVAIGFIFGDQIDTSFKNTLLRVLKADPQVGTIFTGGKMNDTSLVRELRELGMNLRPVNMTRAVAVDQNGIPVASAGAELNVRQLSDSFLGFKSNLEGLENDPMARDYVQLLEIVSLIRAARLLAGEKKALKGEALRVELIKQLGSEFSTRNVISIVDGEFVINGKNAWAAGLAMGEAARRKAQSAA